MIGMMICLHTYENPAPEKKAELVQAIERLREQIPGLEIKAETYELGVLCQVPDEKGREILQENVPEGWKSYVVARQAFAPVGPTIH